jgi:hypothetical protein
MNSFWANLFEHFRSKSAWLFVPVLLAFIGLILIPEFVLPELIDFNSEEVPRVVIYAMPGIVLLLVAGIVVAVRRARVRRRNRHQSSSLSRDEINKARSKLKSSFKSPPVKQLPDIDLKY